MNPDLLIHWLSRRTNNDAANRWINISEERKYKMSHVFHVLYTVQCTGSSAALQSILSFLFMKGSGRCVPCLLSKQLLFVEKLLLVARFPITTIFLEARGSPLPLSPTLNQENLKSKCTKGKFISSAKFWDLLVCYLMSRFFQVMRGDWHSARSKEMLCRHGCRWGKVGRRKILSCLRFPTSTSQQTTWNAHL